jgi:PA14 domain
VRVFLDGVLLVDQWKNQPPTTYAASRAVTAGSHQVKMEYYEHAGGAVAKLHHGRALAADLQVAAARRQRHR